MVELLINAVEDSLWDSLRLFPFLLVTYLILEYIEHKTNDRVFDLMNRVDKVGPVVGALLGVVPQCGFSAVASNFYAARVISLGTLMAIFLSTSDEMLPVMISSGVEISIIIKILAIKVVIAMVAGFVIDALIRKSAIKSAKLEIRSFCEHEGCHCHEENILVSALRHSVRITLFIFVITFILECIIQYVGEDSLETIFFNRPVIGEMTAGLVGLIPNCSASVVITQLYLDKAISTGSMFSGLLVSAGVGLLVLFRVNSRPLENFKIMMLLYVIGVVVGVVINYIDFTL